MHSYIITFFNKKTHLRKTETTLVYNFPEAARDAYIKRSGMGFEWEITSIVKKAKNV